MKNQMGIGAKKSMRIIRTETGRAASEGTLKSYDEAKSEGLDLIRTWLSTLDARVRDTHSKMDKQEADENDMFTLPRGTLVRGPNLSGIAEEDINCRCTIYAKLPDIDTIDVRAARDASGKTVDIKNMSYDEWAKLKKIKYKDTVRAICT